VLLQAIRTTTAFSLIDYGCGYGALADHLASREMRHCAYIGYDISASMRAAARRRPCPLISCRYVGRNEPLPEGDYCLASGVFNVSLGTEPGVWFEYMTHVWDEMNRVGRRAFAFNCLSASSDVDRRTDLLHYADPARVFDYCRRRYSPWVALFHDYPLPEFTVIVRKPQPGA
jgi:SAM-dependent methyltransferase